MKIALLGSAPSSLHLAPFGRPDWKVWGCSPGVYYQCGSPNAWFELHRWEPPTIGVPSKQKQWFSPEYVAWMSLRDPAVCPVWMKEAVPEIPASRALPVDELVGKYGSYFFTSSLAWMAACAIENILEARANGKDTGDDEIAMFGVDMAATEEYGFQRAGCQHFLLIAADLGIKITVPPESDLLRPMPLYGIDESTHWSIKMTARNNDHQLRIQQAQTQIKAAEHTLAFFQGAADELAYHRQTWGGDRTGMGMGPHIMAKMPKVRTQVLQDHVADHPPPFADLAAPTPTQPSAKIVLTPKKKLKRKR